MPTGGMQEKGYAHAQQGSSEWTPGEGPQTHAGQPTVGDKIRGGAEKLAGKVAGKPGMMEKGQERQSGQHMASGQGSAEDYHY